MGEPAEITTDEPLGKRYPADKLAILCAERPMLFVLVRSWAILALLTTLTFVFDGVARLIAWIAHSSIATFLFLDEAASAQDRADAMSFGDGLPHDLLRLVLLVAFAAALVVTQLLATRGLPSGVTAMRTAIVEGLPWPGHWRLVAAVARRVRPWAITALGLVGTVWVVVNSWPLSGEDWSYLPLVVLLAQIATWAGAYLSWKGAGPLTRVLPSYVDVSPENLNQAQRQVEEADEAEAARRWPHRRALRLTAAVRVFAVPPPPLRQRGERRRQVWWTGTTTSVEALATELVLQALVEAWEAGLVTISGVHRRNPNVVASLPPDEQPNGLARLVAGFHREGLVPGRQVRGRLSDVLHPAYSTDQHALVIGIGLEDLASAGVASQDGDGWQLSANRLHAVAARLADAGQWDHRMLVTSELDVVALRRRVARQLKHKRTTEAEGGGLKELLFSIHQMSAERRERRRYQLPTSDGT